MSYMFRSCLLKCRLDMCNCNQSSRLDIDPHYDTDSNCMTMFPLCKTKQFSASTFIMTLILLDTQTITSHMRSYFTNATSCHLFLQPYIHVFNISHLLIIPLHEISFDLSSITNVSRLRSRISCFSFYSVKLSHALLKEWASCESAIC